MKVKQNPNKEEYEAITQAVKENNGYCPCSLIQDENTKCMCKEFREQTEEGYCHCGRFYKEEDKKPLRVYLAGPIFTEASRMFLDSLYDKLVPILPTNAEIYVPHRNKEINDKTKCATAYDIYWGDYNRLKETDLLIACIGADLPPIGTTCEIGIFTQMIDADTNKKLIALFDDCREGFLTCQGEVGQQKLDAMRNEPGEAQTAYCNLFLTGAIKTHGKLVCTSEELVKAVKEMYAKENKKQ